MIGKLYGKIDSIADDHIILDVGGVGYLVHCAVRNLSKFQVGEFISVFIETHVREDRIQLFGFCTTSEKKFFGLLNSVKGVGNKVALSILSSFNIEQLTMSILSLDKHAYKIIPGVGPKVWERILIELKDKIKDYNNALSNEFQGTDAFQSPIKNDLLSDTVSALSNLGINRAEAYKIADTILKSDPEININELIKKSLQKLSKI